MTLITIGASRVTKCERSLHMVLLVFDILHDESLGLVRKTHTFTHMPNKKKKKKCERFLHMVLLVFDILHDESLGLVLKTHTFTHMPNKRSG